LGITRSYITRHGPGPLPTEDKELTSLLIDKNNPANRWQRHFRVGWLDLAYLKYGLSLSKVNALAVTHLDAMALKPEWKVCKGYRIGDDEFRLWTDRLSFKDSEARTMVLSSVTPVYETRPHNRIMEEISRTLDLPVVIMSNGPDVDSKTHLESFFS